MTAVTGALGARVCVCCTQDNNGRRHAIRRPRRSPARRHAWRRRAPPRGASATSACPRAQLPTASNAGRGCRFDSARRPGGPGGSPGPQAGGRGATGWPRHRPARCRAARGRTRTPPQRAAAVVPAARRFPSAPRPARSPSPARASERCVAPRHPPPPRRHILSSGSTISSLRPLLSTVRKAAQRWTRACMAATASGVGGGAGPPPGSRVSGRMRTPAGP